MQDEKVHIVMISLYVDDLIIIGDAPYLIKEIKQQMSQVFEMKHLGELRYYLRLEIWRDSGQTFLSQGKYIKGMLERFRMDQCKPAVVPLQQNIKLQSEDGSKEVDAILYRQLVGSLIYLTTTRPYLAYAVSVLSQYMSRPLESQWNVAKSVLRSTRYCRLRIGSGVITWSNKKQNTVSLSSVEVEYQAMCTTTCEEVWLWRILQDVGEEQIDATTIRCEN
eukprot:PITA_30965